MIVPEYYIFGISDWVNTLTITKDKKFVMIRQYLLVARKPTNYEFCGGCVDPEDGSPMAAAGGNCLKKPAMATAPGK